MKILAITFDTEMSGGANRSFMMVITELCRKYGHEVYTIIPGKGPIEKELQSNNIPYRSVDLPRVGTVLTGSVKDVYRKLKENYKAIEHAMIAKKIASSFRNERFDLVYINGTPQLCGAYLARELRLPYVWHFRGYLKRGCYYSWNQKQLFNDTKAKIIVISQNMVVTLPEILKISPKQIVLVHNGLKWEKNIKTSSQNRTGGLHCVLCGRLVRSKGQGDAIEALRILRERSINNIYIHFAGDLNEASQSYLEELREKIRINRLEDRVIFEGQIEDMAAFRENMNIELMCSICEPFGRVTVEGMRSGLVVIGSNTGGTVDIIQDGYNGYLYQQGNSTDLADKIQYVIEHENEALYIAKNAIEFTKTHFTVEQNVSAINDVLCEAVRKE